MEFKELLKNLAETKKPAKIADLWEFRSETINPALTPIILPLKRLMNKDFDEWNEIKKNR